MSMDAHMEDLRDAYASCAVVATSLRVEVDGTSFFRVL